MLRIMGLKITHLIDFILVQLNVFNGPLTVPTSYVQNKFSITWTQINNISLEDYFPTSNTL